MCKANKCQEFNKQTNNANTALETKISKISQLKIIIMQYNSNDQTNKIQ